MRARLDIRVSERPLLNRTFKSDAILYNRTAIVMVSRRFRIKVEADGREYLVLRKAYDVRENAEREAARLSAETGEEYKVVEA